jgi:hypothetical protein
MAEEGGSGTLSGGRGVAAGSEPRSDDTRAAGEGDEACGVLDGDDPAVPVAPGEGVGARSSDANADGGGEELMGRGVSSVGSM